MLADLYHLKKSRIAWLNSINIPHKYRFRTIKLEHNTIIVDAFLKKTNTIYAFYGDYLHGNPKVFQSNYVNIVSGKTFGFLYKKTMCREKLFRDAGYQVISIWENDWKCK